MMRQATNPLLVEHKAPGVSETPSLQVTSLHQLTPLYSQMLEGLPSGMLRTQRNMHDQSLSCIRLHLTHLHKH